MDVQIRQLRVVLEAEGFDAIKIEDRVKLYLAQRQSAVELDGFENTLNSSLDPQLASADPLNPMRIVDHKLLTLSQKVFILDSDLNLIATRLKEFGDNARAAAARGDEAGANAWRERVSEYQRYQTEYTTSRATVGIARDAQTAAESLYSNSAGYTRQQIDDAMMRLITNQQQTGGVDSWMSQQLVGNMPGIYATLVDKENRGALAQAAGTLGLALGSIRRITGAGGRAPVSPEPNPGAGNNSSLPPALRSTKDVVGTSEGANGVWIREPVPLKGADYQEQISGVERGTAYYVKGTKFDGIYRAEKVLVDAKDWKGYAPVNSRGELQPWFVTETLGQAEKQLRSAAGLGYSVRWVVSDEAAAGRVRTLFAERNISIQIVVVPKK
jgi:Restriction endonuclease fold toxin 5